MARKATNPNSGEAFAALAEQYCTLIERRRRPSARGLLRQAHRLLPRLYAEALCLKPEKKWDRPESSRVPSKEWLKILTSLQSQLGFLGRYRLVFDPYSQDETADWSCLANDLAEIYEDLKEGLTLWQSGRQTAALNIWEEGFRIHWLDHASGAIRALGWLEFFYRMARSAEDIADLQEAQKRPDAKKPPES